MAPCKNMIDQGLSKKCIVRVSYAIGKAEPYEFTVDTFNTLNVDESVLDGFVSKFDMKPGAIIARPNLLDVDYTTDTLFSHFGTEGRNWEQKEDI